jgi:hypothetical protein
MDSEGFNPPNHAFFLESHQAREAIQNEAKGISCAASVLTLRPRCVAKAHVVCPQRALRGA